MLTITKIFGSTNVVLDLERLDYCVDIELADKVDKIAPNVDKEIRAVCMMSVSSADNEEKENL